MIYKSIDELIGKTPLLELKHIEEKFELKARLLAKLEYFNPAGSAKDRIGKQMIDDAEKSGLLKPGSVIIEETSGNTGIGLACVAASRGYKMMVVMPDTMSPERIKIMKAYGAEVILTDGKLGMNGAVDKAKELAKEIPNSFLAGQFDNPSNPKAHYITTGPEIWSDTDGRIDILVATVGTGGTITGTGTYLKEMNPEIQVIAVEPENSPILSKGTSGSHGIQGIGAGFIPQILDTKIYDEVITVKDEDAFEYAKLVGKTEGFLAGISSGAGLKAAIEVASRPENTGKTVVFVMTDSGDRYYSTKLFEA